MRRKGGEKETTFVQLFSHFMLEVVSGLVPADMIQSKIKDMMTLPMFLVSPREPLRVLVVEAPGTRIHHLP